MKFDVFSDAGEFDSLTSYVINVTFSPSSESGRTTKYPSGILFEADEPPQAGCQQHASVFLTDTASAVAIDVGSQQANMIERRSGFVWFKGINVTLLMSFRCR